MFIKQIPYINKAKALSICINRGCCRHHPISNNLFILYCLPFSDFGFQWFSIVLQVSSICTQDGKPVYTCAHKFSFLFQQCGRDAGCTHSPQSCCKLQSKPQPQPRAALHQTNNLPQGNTTTLTVRVTLIVISLSLGVFLNI